MKQKTWRSLKYKGHTIYFHTASDPLCVGWKVHGFEMWPLSSLKKAKEFVNKVVKK